MAIDVAPGRIEHSGVVERTEAGKVFVRIVVNGACGACSERKSCSMASSQVKVVEVATPDAGRFAAGDNVTVGVKRRAGMLSVALGYGGALAVLLAVLAMTVGVAGWSEGRGALASLGAVALYYMALWLFRRKIEHTIQFTITKI